MPCSMTPALALALTMLKSRDDDELDLLSEDNEVHLLICPPAMTEEGLATRLSFCFLRGAEGSSGGGVCERPGSSPLRSRLRLPSSRILAVVSCRLRP